MPFQRTNINDIAYVWSDSGNKDNDSCVISAHGGYSFIVRKKNIGSSKKGITPMLHFYCAHGYVLKANASLANVISGKYVITESVSATKKMQDYILSKHENTTANSVKHNRFGYSYDDVRAVPEVMKSAEISHAKHAMKHHASMTGSFNMTQGIVGDGKNLDLLDKEAIERLKGIYKSAKEKFVAHTGAMSGYGNTMDIVTIRNRPFRTLPTLSELITELYAAGFDYKNIHCFFCRSPMESFSTKSQSAMLQPGRKSGVAGGEEF